MLSVRRRWPEGVIGAGAHCPVVCSHMLPQITPARELQPQGGQGAFLHNMRERRIMKTICQTIKKIKSTKNYCRI